MSQGRRHFTDEFKREPVALLVSSGRPLSWIASELGIFASMLRNWRSGSGGRDAVEGHGLAANSSRFQTSNSDWQIMCAGIVTHEQIVDTYGRGVRLKIQLTDEI